MGAEIAGVLTDAEGRWRSEALPATAGAGTRLDVRFMHPDYSTIVHRLTTTRPRTMARADHEARRRSVAGTVRSPTGRPVAGASVVVTGSNDSGSFQPLKTDAQGRFQAGHFIASNWPSVILTVQAEGFALGHAADHRRGRDPAAGHHAGPAQTAGARWSIARPGDRRPGRRRHKGLSQRGFRLGGPDRRRRPVRLVRGPGHRLDPPRRLQGTVRAGARPPGGRRVGRGHDHPAPPAAPAWHRDRRHDRPADRAVHPGQGLGPEPSRRPAGVAARQPEQQDIHRRPLRYPRRSLPRPGPAPLDPDRGRRLRTGRVPRVPRQRRGHRARLQAPQGRAADRDRPRTRRPSARRRRRGPEQCRQRCAHPERPVGGQPRRRRGAAYEDRPRRPLSIPAASETGLGFGRPRRRVRRPLARGTGRLARHHAGAGAGSRAS